MADNKPLVSLVLLLCTMAVSSAQSEVPRGSVWDGVYTAEQAQRGIQPYQEHCQSCHAADMRGGPAARGLLGLEFQYLWKDKSLLELFTALREKMPPGNPGSLDDQAYIDVMASILQRNEFPAGEVELTTDPDTLRTIAIRWE